MKNRKRLIAVYIVTVILSLGLSFISFWSGVFYSWLNASGSWSAEKAAPYAYGSFALAFVFFVSFAFLAYKLIVVLKSKNGT